MASKSSHRGSLGRAYCRSYPYSFVIWHDWTQIIKFSSGSISDAVPIVAMILKSGTRNIASCPLYLQSESMAKLGVPTTVRATTIASLAQQISMLKWWHLQNSSKSSMADFDSHSLSKIPMRRIVPFLVFKEKLTAGSETNSVWSSPQSELWVEPIMSRSP